MEKMIKLPYDTGYLELAIENENQALLMPSISNYQATDTQENIVKDALAAPIYSLKLSDMVKGKKNIVIITSDHTRPVPSHITIPIILKEIESSNAEAKVTLLISTGTHRPMSEEEILKRFGKEVVQQVEIVNHFAENIEDMDFLGNLPSGGELWINKLAVQADFLMSEGFIEPHFFAGFSGGRKSVLPGIASIRSVMYNHNADFIDNPNARAGILENNPLHLDMIWAAEKSKLAFILNVVINAKKEIIHCVAGEPYKAHYQGCEFVRKLTAVKSKPADIVIATNGGYPLDQNIYQAVKGMTAAEASAKPGAIIIMVAYCRDGLGGEQFYKLLAENLSPKEALDKIKAIPREKTIADQWESHILARILVKHKIIMVTNPKLKDDVKKMHMEYAETLEEALSKARTEKGAAATLTIIPDGVSIIVES